MPRILNTALQSVALLGLLGTAACAELGDAPTRLDQLVVTDPNFDFATTETVRLELRAEDGAAPKAIEVSDSEGRRLMDGAFRGSASMDFKVPVGRAQTLKVRVGQGDEAVQHEVSIDANRRAVSEL